MLALINIGLVVLIIIAIRSYRAFGDGPGGDDLD